MRGLRGLAGALALAVLAGEARAQYYPYNPYPQQTPYGCNSDAPYPGAYGPAFNGYPQGSYYPGAPPVATPNQYYQPPSQPLYGTQSTDGPPIFSQPALTQPAFTQPAMPRAPYTGPSGERPAPRSATMPPTLPALTAPAVPPPVNAAAPQVLVPTPAKTASFPRNLPSGPAPKAPVAYAPGSPQTPAQKNVDDDDIPEDDDAPLMKQPLKAQPIASQPKAQDDDEAPARKPLLGLGVPANQTEANPLFPPQNGADPQTYNPRVWGTIEYLLWGMRNGPLGVPLITRNPNPGAIGAIGEPGTQVLYPGGSNHSVDYGAFNGGRWTFGGWIDPDRTFGVEGSGFGFERRDSIFAASSAGGNAPVVSVPFFATQPFPGNPMGETSLNAGGAANVVSVNNYSHLWGFEANGLVNFSNSPAFRLAGIAGFRYLNLTESLFLTDVFLDPTTAGAVTVRDGFGTQNHFFGGQIGLRGGCNFGRFTIDSSFKIAFGDNSQNLSIGGQTGVTNGAFGLTGSQTGLFAEPSNIGHFHRDQFAVVPEFQLQLGYLLTPNVRPFVAYNFLYLTQVIRPGNQIDRNINPTELPVFGPGGPVVGFPSPLPSFHNSDFWAQGLNVGVEVRY